MEPHRLPVFDTIYDGNLNLAKRIMSVFRDSNNFTLTQYPGQNDFYEEYLSKYDDYRAALDVLYASHNTDSKVVTEHTRRLDEIREVLNQLANEGRLNFAHFLLAYMSVLRHIEVVRKAYRNDYYAGQTASRIIEAHMYPEYSRPKSSFATTLRDFGNQFIFVVPFTSISGAFGFNTFLYLYLNGISPVAITLSPYKVHYDAFRGNTYNVAMHDFSHYVIYARALEHSSLHSNNIKVDSTGQTYYHNLSQAYRTLFDRYSNNITLLKSFILLLFVVIHEVGYFVTCPPYDLSTIDYTVMDDIRPFVAALTQQDDVTVFETREFLADTYQRLCDEVGSLLPIYL